MARAIRILYPGAFYHIMSRGNERRAIYRDDEDCRRFLCILGETAERFGFVFHAYALMTNHYHFLLETPKAMLSRGLQHINGAYSQYFNRRHERVGHLFQGRFKALLIERDSYLLTLSRYIHQNPTKAGLASLPWQYPWSSCRHFLGLESPPPWLEIAATLRYFRGDRESRRRGYADFLLAPAGDPTSHAVGQLLLGSDLFIAQCRAKAASLASRDTELAPRTAFREPPAAELVLDTIRRLIEKEGTAVARWSRAGSRPLALYLMRASGLFTLKDIALRFSLTPSGVSRAVSSFQQRMSADPELQAQIRRVQAAMAGGDSKTQDVTPQGGQ